MIDLNNQKAYGTGFQYSWFWGIEEASPWFHNSLIFQAKKLPSQNQNCRMRTSSTRRQILFLRGLIISWKTLIGLAGDASPVLKPLLWPGTPSVGVTMTKARLSKWHSVWSWQTAEQLWRAEMGGNLGTCTSKEINPEMPPILKTTYP